jgi:hypothetical protein
MASSCILRYSTRCYKHNREPGRAEKEASRAGSNLSFVPPVKRDVTACNISLNTVLREVPVIDLIEEDGEAVESSHPGILIFAQQNVISHQGYLNLYKSVTLAYVNTA